MGFVALTGTYATQNEEDCFSQGFYFIDDYRLAILRQSEPASLDRSLAIYDTIRTLAKDNQIRQVPRLLLGLPTLICRDIGFYGPGAIPSDEGALFPTNRERSLLAIKMKGFDDAKPSHRFFLVIAFEDLFALASKGVEKPVEFEEWKHFTLEAQLPPRSRCRFSTVGVCGLEILILESDMSPFQCKLWIYDFSPGARRTNLASGQQQRYTLRWFNLRGDKIPPDRNHLWSILPQCLVLRQVSRPSSVFIFTLLRPDSLVAYARSRKRHIACVGTVNDFAAHF